jgi:hypothetical protein
MTTQLHQILPVLKSKQDQMAKGLDEARRALGNPTALGGFTKTYTPKDEEGDRLPSEGKRIQYNAADIATLVAENWIKLLDLIATKEYANTEAKADVVIGARTLVHDAPVSYLLSLEKLVTEMLAFVNALPTLDPALEWSPADLPGHWKAAPVDTVKTKKIMKPVVMYDATDKHPAQVKEVGEDVLVGYWKMTQFSGALPAAQVQGMKDRLVQLREAVLHAREKANSIVVTEQDQARAVVEFVFQG